MTARADVIVRNTAGLHARPATELVRLVTSLDSAVELDVNGSLVDASSILSVMAAGVTCGQVIGVVCKGDSSDADLATLVAAFESGLGE